MKYVIDPGAALALADRASVIRPDRQLLAPTLLRSQVLAILYAEVRRGDRSREDASRCLDHLRALSIRLLGDRVLQRRAWDLAERLGWADTFVAEYVALTQLQADALITTSDELAAAVAGVVHVGCLADIVD